MVGEASAAFDHNNVHFYVISILVSDPQLYCLYITPEQNRMILYSDSISKMRPKILARFFKL